MKKYGFLALLLSLVIYVGCRQEPPKPATPPATPPAGQEEKKPGDTGAPAEQKPAEQKPAENK